MTLELTGTKAALLEAELKQDLANSQAEEAYYLEYVRDPGRRERPVRGLPEIRESIEIIELKLAEATKRADAERGKLSTADEVRKLLAAAQDNETNARKTFHAAVNTAHTALQDLATAHRNHRETISNHTRQLINAGIPIEGAELDGEPIELRGGIQHGDTTLRAVGEPITYEWAISIQRCLSK